MSYIEWTNSFSVGLPEIDRHHHHLFDLLNKAFDACMLTKQKDVLSIILKELDEYAVYHFAAEEKLMSQSFYPDLTAHHNEHASFISKISELRKMLSEDINDCTVELVDLTQFLMTWLSHHIKEVDMQYSQLLTSGNKK